MPGGRRPLRVSRNTSSRNASFSGVCSANLGCVHSDERTEALLQLGQRARFIDGLVQGVVTCLAPQRSAPPTCPGGAGRSASHALLDRFEVVAHNCDRVQALRVLLDHRLEALHGRAFVQAARPVGLLLEGGNSALQ
eukprot:CAMPEP_0117596368 /NCGR_PEP_ID=MMETSP0784-20121206/74271_1 /TAXON_ID=39447 /ORGANISM="" /LENGTH=136 /DNA_ID=CAMNT_0005398637 /DNA_START=560 /DNA_END=967 /DNA_ORIENTATION=-